jgi:hypothetical protein
MATSQARLSPLGGSVARLVPAVAAVAAVVACGSA